MTAPTNKFKNRPKILFTILAVSVLLIPVGWYLFSNESKRNGSTNDSLPLRGDTDAYYENDKLYITFECCTDALEEYQNQSSKLGPWVLDLKTHAKKYIGLNNPKLDVSYDLYNHDSKIYFAILADGFTIYDKVNETSEHFNISVITMQIAASNDGQEVYIIGANENSSHVDLIVYDRISKKITNIDTLKRIVTNSQNYRLEKIQLLGAINQEETYLLFRYGPTAKGPSSRNSHIELLLSLHKGSLAINTIFNITKFMNHGVDSYAYLENANNLYFLSEDEQQTKYFVHYNVTNGEAEVLFSSTAKGNPSCMSSSPNFIVIGLIGEGFILFNKASKTGIARQSEQVWGSCAIDESRKLIYFPADLDELMQVGKMFAYNISSDSFQTISPFP